MLELAFQLLNCCAARVLRQAKSESAEWSLHSVQVRIAQKGGMLLAAVTMRKGAKEIIRSLSLCPAAPAAACNASLVTVLLAHKSPLPHDTLHIPPESKAVIVNADM